MTGFPERPRGQYQICLAGKCSGNTLSGSMSRCTDISTLKTSLLAVIELRPVGETAMTLSDIIQSTRIIMICFGLATSAHEVGIKNFPNSINCMIQIKGIDNSRMTGIGFIPVTTLMIKIV